MVYDTLPSRHSTVYDTPQSRRYGVYHTLPSRLFVKYLRKFSEKIKITQGYL